MPNLYRNENSNPKWNAQRNLMGRTHYVDDDTLRFHKSRVISTMTSGNGLLFVLITSDALDMNNTKRGFRYVIFDMFGTVVGRVSLEEAYRTSSQATKAMWAYLNTLDAVGLTLSAIDRAEHYHKQEMDELRAKIQERKAA